ncbi:MAG: chromophore lyase CpcT/CpeT [Bacteroidetes bacterium]|nr:chromophore lyase CpcT/CpeT [Bacteroidota bacterium]MBK9798592.1 chromophore lyase CpcT/CpeT [Bacteroidota bacterium]MBP6413548.1 chromophore lyase CpcT/CpeT [Bacteroidia bacterium]
MKNLFLLLCVVFQLQAAAQSKELKKLSTWIEGNFNSSLQAEQDSDYFDIRLHIKQIWKDNSNGNWFYVEQAMATDQAKPYRQRVYHITQVSKDTFESAVYTFKKPLRFAGDWKNETPLANLTPDSLETRKGCSVFLVRKDKNTYVGSTHEKDCSSDLRGAKYASSKVTLTKNSLLSWDQGFDAEGKQVWGATKGGYSFIKETK